MTAEAPKTTSTSTVSSVIVVPTGLLVQTVPTVSATDDDFGDPNAEDGSVEAWDNPITPEHPDNPYKMPSPWRMPAKYDFIVNHENLCHGLERKRGAEDPLTYLAVVVSAAGNSLIRNIVRQNFPVPKFVRRMFLLGLPVKAAKTKTECNAANTTCFVDEELLAEVRRENDEYGDIVIGDFFDVYRNLTVKVAAMYYWKVKYCPAATFVVKHDDDMAVDFDRLDLLYRTELPKLPARPSNATTKKLWPWERRMIAGGLITTENPQRSETHRHYISLERYPGKEYPQYPQGCMYLASQALAEAIVRLMPRTGWIHIEDVWGTITAIHANALVYHVPPFKKGNESEDDPCKYPAEMFTERADKKLEVPPDMNISVVVKGFPDSMKDGGKEISKDLVEEALQRFAYCKALRERNSLSER